MAISQYNLSKHNLRVGGADVSVTNPASIAVEKATASSTSGKVTVGNSSTAILAVNANRKAAIIVNDSNQTVFLNYSATAVMNEGIRLNASGGSIREELYTGAITGICSSGSKNVTVTEM